MGFAFLSIIIAILLIVIVAVLLIVMIAILLIVRMALSVGTLFPPHPFLRDCMTSHGLAPGVAKPKKPC